MKKSIQKIEQSVKLQMLQKKAQSEIKGGVQIVKICTNGFRTTSAFDG